MVRPDGPFLAPVVKSRTHDDDGSVPPFESYDVFRARLLPFPVSQPLFIRRLLHPCVDPFVAAAQEEQPVRQVMFESSTNYRERGHVFALNSQVE